MFIYLAFLTLVCSFSVYSNLKFAIGSSPRKYLVPLPVVLGTCWRVDLVQPLTLWHPERQVDVNDEGLGLREKRYWDEGWDRLACGELCSGCTFVKWESDMWLRIPSIDSHRQRLSPEWLSCTQYAWTLHWDQWAEWWQTSTCGWMSPCGLRPGRNREHSSFKQVGDIVGVWGCLAGSEARFCCC